MALVPKPMALIEQRTKVQHVAFRIADTAGFDFRWHVDIWDEKVPALPIA